MRSGRLKHLITLEQPVLTSDGMGGNTTTWTRVMQFWGSISPVRSNSRNQEFLDARRMEGETLHVVLARYDSRFLIKYRLDYQGRKLNIRTVINLEERNRMVEMLCTEEI